MIALLIPPEEHTAPGWQRIDGGPDVVRSPTFSAGRPRSMAE